MASLLAVKHFKGKFKRVAGINPDYSYGRNNWEAFRQILARYGVEAEFVAEQWPKVGTLDLTSHIAALKAAKPDLIFSSMRQLVARVPSVPLWKWTWTGFRGRLPNSGDTLTVFDWVSRIWPRMAPSFCSVVTPRVNGALECSLLAVWAAPLKLLFVLWPMRSRRSESTVYARA